jgi:hypothetical protein
VHNGEATNTNFSLWLEPTIYRTQGEHANHYPTDAIILQLKVFQIIATQMSEVTAADDLLPFK